MVLVMKTTVLRKRVADMTPEELEFARAYWKKTSERYRSRPGSPEKRAAQAKEYGSRPEVKARRNRQRRIRRYQRKYGLTPTGVVARIEAQSGKCALCGEALPRFTGKRGEDRPVVDHSHTNGHVRGIVHVQCNILIGVVENHPAALDNLRGYLARYGH